MARPSHLAQLKAFKKALSSRTPVDRMLLFGSRATGRARRDSDFDLIIVSPAFVGKRFRHRPLGFYRYWTMKYPVDFLCYTPAEFRRLKKEPSIVREALRRGRRI